MFTGSDQEVERRNSFLKPPPVKPLEHRRSILRPAVKRGNMSEIMVNDHSITHEKDHETIPVHQRRHSNILEPLKRTSSVPVADVSAKNTRPIWLDNIEKSILDADKHLKKEIWDNEGPQVEYFLKKYMVRNDLSLHFILHLDTLKAEE